MAGASKAIRLVKRAPPRCCCTPRQHKRNHKKKSKLAIIDNLRYLSFHPVSTDVEQVFLTRTPYLKAVWKGCFNFNIVAFSQVPVNPSLRTQPLLKAKFGYNSTSDITNPSNAPKSEYSRLSQAVTGSPHLANADRRVRIFSGCVSSSKPTLLSSRYMSSVRWFTKSNFGDGGMATVVLRGRSDFQYRPTPMLLLKHSHASERQTRTQSRMRMWRFEYLIVFRISCMIGYLFHSFNIFQK